MGKLAAARVITVEYLQPSMSRQLLHKFPDDSAFDFDYSQSGIWSPLVPYGGGRGNVNTFVSRPFPSVVGARRLFTDGYDKVPQEKAHGKKKKKKLGEVRGKIRKKSPKKGGPAKKGSFGFSVSPSASPTPKKGWNQVLKAAILRHFRKQRSPLQLILPTL